MDFQNQYLQNSAILKHTLEKLHTLKPILLWIQEILHQLYVKQHLLAAQ
jgi:hypothetical protein